MNSQLSPKKLALAAVLQICAFALAASATVLLILGLPALLAWLEYHRFASLRLLPVAFALCAPVGAGLLAASRVRRFFIQQGDTPHGALIHGLGIATLYRSAPPARVIIVVVLLGYFLTWAIGVPAVQSAIASSEVAASSFVRPDGELELLHSGAEFGVPLLPGVVLLYHYHIGGRAHGWGGLKLYFWYGAGQREILQYPLLVT